MKSANSLFGPLRALHHIRPPGRSYAEWHRFLDQCRKAGVAAIYKDEDGGFVDFVTPLGFALLRRFRWLRDSEAAGLSFEDAEAAFTASFERDHAAITEAADQQHAAADRAESERGDRKKYGLPWRW